MKMLAQKIHSGPFGKFVAGKVQDQKSENTGVAWEKPSTQEKCVTSLPKQTVWGWNTRLPKTISNAIP